VFRLESHIFQIYKKGRWQSSDYLLRACEDPFFIDITVTEALELLRVIDMPQGGFTETIQTSEIDPDEVVSKVEGLIEQLDHQLFPN
jgi:hypothetical protein